MPSSSTSDLTIVIPMAGNGVRFRDAGYSVPKPLIDVQGRPMIAHVIDNVRIDHCNLILISRRHDVEAYPEMFSKLQSHYGCQFILLDNPTEGAACTVLHALDLINNDISLLLANSDQVVDYSVKHFIEDAWTRGLDGSILAFHEAQRHPKWSYAMVGGNGLVTETREKVAISTHATVGIYWFAKGKYFVDAANAMIAQNDRCNNEYYVCPTYNYLIRQGMKIGIYEIAKEQMHGLGTPEDLRTYLQTVCA